jgi:YgiT-type zinc finger domain-containing protein
MRCAICKTGETTRGTATVTLQRGSTTVVVKEVPALVCEDCGEYYLDSKVARHVYDQADAAVARLAEIEILRYAA